jgi:dethiobiotin synthetase
VTLVVVTGTGTDVGKTWFTAATIRALGGDRAIAKKPAQSFEPGPEPTDADVLAGATGQTPYDVCPQHRWYEVAVAPPMAADMLGRPRFTIADLAAEIGAPSAPSAASDRPFTFVEGAGGPRSPIADDGDTVDLAGALPTDVVVLVADAGLGTINAVRLGVAALAGRWPLVVALNRYDATDVLHVRNADWLRTREDLEVVTDPEALASSLDSVRR